MDKESILSKIKSIIYKIVLPIYLWSVGCKTLDEYLAKIEKQYEAFKK